MQRLGVRSALVIASQSIDEHPVWSPDGRYWRSTSTGDGERSTSLDSSSRIDMAKRPTGRRPRAASGHVKDRRIQGPQLATVGSIRASTDRRARRHDGRAQAGGVGYGLHHHEKGKPARDSVDERHGKLLWPCAGSGRKVGCLHLRAERRPGDPPLITIAGGRRAPARSFNVAIRWSACFKQSSGRWQLGQPCISKHLSAGQGEIRPDRFGRLPAARWLHRSSIGVNPGCRLLGRSAPSSRYLARFQAYATARGRVS